MPSFPPGMSGGKAISGDGTATRHGGSSIRKVGRPFPVTIDESIAAVHCGRQARTEGLAVAGDRIDFDSYIPFGLTAIANKVSRGASRTYRQLFGIGINEWRILANLKVNPGTTANRICAHSGLDKAAVSRSLRDMEQAGLIRVDPARRARQLHLTPAGDALHARVIKVALAREAALLAGFDAAERRQLRALINRLHANVEAVNSADYRDLAD